MRDERFIQEAIPEKRKGRLHTFAEEHKALTERGTIDVNKTQNAIDKLPEGKNKLQRQRELNLAKTLKGLRNR